jgi:serine/threonine protein kinase
MSVATQIASLAVHSLAAAANLAGFDGATKVAGSLGKMTGQQFGDQSRRLLDALRQSSQRAWNTIEIALAGNSLRERIRTIATRTEDRIFATQLQTFLATVPLGEDAHAVRTKALAELRHARKAGLLNTDLDITALEKAADPLARYTTPAALVDAQEQALAHVARTLHEQGYIFLARVLLVRPHGGQPLLLVALSYFFRRGVESDETLFRSLSIERLGHLQETQESGFAALELALDLQGQRVQSLLDEVQEATLQTRDAVLDLHQQVMGQNEQLRQIGQAVEQLLEQRQLQRRELHPGDSLSIRTDEELRIVRQVIGRYRALPEDEKRLLPSLLNAIGKLEVVAGNFDNAQRDFQTVASLVHDSHLRAEAHYNAYRASLERRDYHAAMLAFGSAIAIDPKRYAPFPVETYHAQQILGAGGFGVAFLCHHRFMQAQVVVKSLWLEPFDTDADKVFTEAQLLRQLDHPAIIRISECGYADSTRRDRPYLVMDYFDGITLDEHVRHHGPFSLADYLLIAREIARGLHAAHTRGILHGDVKPANLLVRRSSSREASPAWQVRLIDFGLARRHHLKSPLNLASTTRNERTLLGQTITGTLAYAAPEQLGESDAPLGPPADIYAFARTSCQLLFGTTTPLPRHWQSIPASLAELLGQCLERAPSDRPADFQKVLSALETNTPVVPLILDALPVAAVASAPAQPPPVPNRSQEPIDLDSLTSILDLVRHVKRLIGMGLFEIAGRPLYPMVRRSDTGGYDVPKPNSSTTENVHPVRELVRILEDQKRMGRWCEPRLCEHLSETCKAAREQIIRQPATLVALGSVTMGLVISALLFGLVIPLTPVPSAGFVLSIIFTAISGIGTLVLAILTIIVLVQHANRQRLCREVIEQLEPTIPGRDKPPEPIQSWPDKATASRIWRVFLVWLLLTACLLVSIIVVGSQVAQRRPKHIMPTGTPVPPKYAK